ncbi:MAG: cupredoxin domain-containing protein [Pseudomonadota bacterium]|nr:cupredoxin domain-containing protein [Pseudomonadota bacterium]MDE3038470.1 cupredoxin domain-containing protein [Pseudomonadota bacterium]
MLPAALLTSAPACADDYVITLKDHQFTPQMLTIPAHQKIKITVKNLDATPAEFESSDLDREKVVSRGSKIIVFVGPLDAGSYGYFDDFNHAVTGIIIAK